MRSGRGIGNHSWHAAPGRTEIPGTVRFSLAAPVELYVARGPLQARLMDFDRLLQLVQCKS